MEEENQRERREVEESQESGMNVGVEEESEIDRERRKTEEGIRRV